MGLRVVLSVFAGNIFANLQPAKLGKNGRLRGLGSSLWAGFGSDREFVWAGTRAGRGSKAFLLVGLCLGVWSDGDLPK